jgi:hypothetical protein
MTVPRIPLTFADAATQASGILGLPALAKLAGRAGRTVYEWQNPQTETGPSLRQALAIDAACRAADPDASPFLDAYAFQLDVQVARQDACRHALADEIAIVAREIGEAVASAIAILNSNASPRDAHRAFAETSQAAEALDALQRRLSSFLPDGAGPHAGNTGGTP